MGGPCDSPYAAPDCEAKQAAKRKKRKKETPKVARPPESAPRKRGILGVAELLKERKKRLNSY